jgi:hypothetical protein
VNTWETQLQKEISGHYCTGSVTLATGLTDVPSPHFLQFFLRITRKMRCKVFITGLFNVVSKLTFV